MKFFEMEEGKIYKGTIGIVKYRMNNGNVEKYSKEEKTWVKTKRTHKNLYEVEFEEIKESKKGWEKVGGNEEYYFVTINGDIKECDGALDNIDNELYNNNNYFSTIEKAEQIRDMNLLQRKMQKFADENNEGEIDWNNDVMPKVRVLFDYSNKEYFTSTNWEEMSVNEVYFTSQKVAGRCIEEVIKPFYNE